MPLRRSVVGVMVAVARVIGLTLIVLAVLSVPQMRFLTGRMAAGLGLLSSVALGLAGAVWLIAVECCLRFFDQFLSRN
jgi:hypothetical protein